MAIMYFQKGLSMTVGLERGLSTGWALVSGSRRALIGSGSGSAGGRGRACLGHGRRLVSGRCLEGWLARGGPGGG